MFFKFHNSIKNITYYITYICLMCVFLLMVTNCYRKKEHQLLLFDKIITKEILCGKDVVDNFSSSQVFEKQNAINYVFEYVFNKTSPNHHYTCSISVAKAGHFIDPKQYDDEYEQLKAEYMNAWPDRWKQQLLIKFPDIGKRAKWGHMFAGPGGASYDLMITTSDELYDIKILISNLMPDTIEDPGLDIEKIAKAISDRYDKR